MIKKNKIQILILSCVFLSSCSSFYQLIKVSPSTRLHDISFTKDDANPLYDYYYSDTLGNDYMRKLRNGYKLDSLVTGHLDDFERIKIILDWTSNQWEHNGLNTPSKSDALTILNEAHDGNNFRCVEYGIVCSAGLNSIGLHARVIGLKTRDVEVVMHGAGHVASEVYLPSSKKWIFIDPQFNVIPVLRGLPLNAVEFQRAIVTKDKDLMLINVHGQLDDDRAAQYISWVGKYLFYFDALFDQRIDDDSIFQEIDGMTKLTLVPAGEKEPRVFQRHSKINYSHYTHSLKDFYRIPQ